MRRSLGSDQRSRSGIRGSLRHRSRVLGFEKDGKEGGRVEVTKIDKKALAANLFEIPAGYPQIPPEQLVGEIMAASMGGVGRPGGLPPTRKARRCIGCAGPISCPLPISS